MNHERATLQQRQRRAYRVRKRVRGTAERPRLSVHRSHKHVYAQVIDDASGRTLASASTVDKDLRSDLAYGGNVAAATVIGKAIAERAAKAGVTKVRFDRGSCKFHGRVAALAEAARAGGLEF